MKKIIFSILILFTWGEIFSQELIPFFDKGKQKWGFQNKETKQIVVEANYDDAVEWWKDKGIVMIDNKYGLIDKNGNKVSPFIHDYIEVEHCEDCRKDELTALFYYESNYSNGRKFYINEKCDCIPYAYYPCPPMVKIDSSNTSKSLKYIQRAEFWYHRGEIDKSFKYADKAIEADTNESSALFWKASHLNDMYDKPIGTIPDNLLLELEYVNKLWSIQKDKKSAELEYDLTGKAGAKITEEQYLEEIKKLNFEDSLQQIKYNKQLKTIDSLRVFYDKWNEGTWNYWDARYDSTFQLLNYYNAALRHQEKNQRIYYSILAGKYTIDYLSDSEKKKIKKELIKNTPRTNRKSDIHFAINPGFAIFPYQKAEINLTFGISDFVFQNAFPVMSGVGLGYESGLDINLQTYKAIAYLQPIGPIHMAVNFLYLKDADSNGFGFRPEFGFSFSALTILWGFNIISDTKFPGGRGNMVGIRLNLPVWRQTYFSQEWGNNLIR